MALCRGDGTAANSSPLQTDPEGQVVLEAQATNQTESLSAEDKAVLLHRKGLARLSATHPWRWPALYELANALLDRFKQGDESQDVDEAILLYREALSLRPSHPPYRYPSLNGLAAALHTRFEEKGRVADLDEAVSLYREGLSILPVEHVNRRLALSNLADALQAQFTCGNQLSDLDEAISLHRQSLALQNAHDPGRLSSLNNLAATLHDRFRQTGQSANLDETILLHREVLLLRTAHDPTRATTLNNLAGALHSRFGDVGQLDDLDEAASLHRIALDLRSAPHPQRWSSLNNLAVVLEARFKHTRHISDLDDAVLLYREALIHVQTDHPHRPISLTNLAASLYTRFDETRQLHDLDEAISLHRKALILFPARDPHRSSALINLSAALDTRFQETGGHLDSDEAITVSREAVACLPSDHPNRSISLINLAMAVHGRFEQTNHLADLEEVVSLYHEALALLPATHVERQALKHGLAQALRAKFQLSGQGLDAEEAISLCRQSLEDLPAEHPRICSISVTLGRLLLDRVTHELGETEKRWGDIIEAVDNFRAAAHCQSARVSERFEAAKIWVRLVDNLNGAHGSALEAYETAIGLLPRMAMLSLDVQSRRDALSPTTDGFARDAAAWAIESQTVEMAIEFLEAGRAIFWSQALQLRTPLDEVEVEAPELAKKLKDISHALERGTLRPISRIVMDSPEQGVSAEMETKRYRQLNADWLATVDEVRQLNGLQDFLRPKSFVKLSAAANYGPVVILNASEREHKCAALVMRRGHDPVHIPLPQFTRQNAVQLVQRIRRLPNASFPLARGEGDRHANKVDPREVDSKNGDTDTILQGVLESLWRRVVQPILLTLGKQKSSSPPRLWWLPTGPFASLPVHAAGIYNAPGSECIGDYIISSYTPTLSALLIPLPRVSEPFKMLAAIQPVTKDQASLPCTKEELQKIEAHVPKECLVQRGIPGAPTHLKNVLSDLPAASVVHLACHGVQDTRNPLDSALLLEDGRLKVSELMELDMPNASLVFLSACQTAMVGDDLPDESIHLAATLLFSGFRGAIATMWSIQDRDGPVIADCFYRHLFSTPESGGQGNFYAPDTTRAANALRLAVGELRDKLQEEKTVSRLVRWVPFVHFGL